MRRLAFAAFAVFLIGIPALAAETDPADLAFWESVKDSNNPAEFRAYLNAFPDGRFAELARIRTGLAGRAPAAAATGGEGVSPKSVAGAGDASGPPPSTGAAGGATFSPNDKVEALSASGWQAATILEVSAGEALVHYAAPGLADERLDLQLIRKPQPGIDLTKPGGGTVTGPDNGGSDSVAKPTGGGDAVAKGEPGSAKGIQPVALEVASGTYGCSLDLSAFTVVGGSGGQNGLSVESRITVTINKDHTYSAFDDDPKPYSYDPASGAITWEAGSLSDAGGPGQYHAESGSKPAIVVDFNDQKLTCTLE